MPKRLPISCLQIRPRSARFAEKMTHRDYLGALIHLGTNRSVLGDILTDENMAYVFCLERMAPFILDHLEKVRNNPVTVTLVEDPADFPGPKLMTAAGSIASVRLDNLVSLFLGESRTKAAGLISGGQVYVDGRLVSRCGYEPKEGERISVRGYGRFRFTEVRGTTRKGRVNVALEKYV